MSDNNSQGKENQDTSPEATRFSVKDRRFWVTKSPDQEEIPESPEKRRLPTYLEELQQKLDEKDKKLKEYIAEVKKENEEFRNRLTRDMERRLEGEKSNLIKGFLTILDSLDRALDSGKPTENPEAFFTGIQIIRNQFLTQLNNNGVQRLSRVGEPFNPETDEAIEVVITNKREEDNLVLEEIESGYIMNDRLIRPAKVKVGRFVE
jgi:molecular chaperone GrpE